MTPPSGFPAAPRPPSRSDLRWPARCTATALIAIIAVNVAGIVSNTVSNWPGALDGVWLLLVVLAGIFFLCWFASARSNTATYGPDRIRAYPGWTVAGWVCPVANLWIPYRVTAEILRASSRRAADAPAASQGASSGGQASVALVRLWWALWLGMWLAFWWFTTDYLAADDHGLGVTAGQQRLDLAFQALSIGAAGCAIAVVAVITRCQARRADEPFFAAGASRPARAIPAWLLSVGLAVALPLAPLLAVAVLIGGRDIRSPLIDRAALAPSPADIVGTWHAGDGGVLVFHRDRSFTATDLSIDLQTGGTPTNQRWSGAGTWQAGGACDGGAPGICLTLGSVADEDGWTEGARSSPVLLLPATPANQDYDAAGYVYEFTKVQHPPGPGRAPATPPGSGRP